MNERLLLLERSIENDLAVIESLYEALGDEEPAAEHSSERLIAHAYRLHNLYNAFENIFQSVAVAFENTLEERPGGTASFFGACGSTSCPSVRR